MAGNSFNSAGADASTGIMSFMAALEAKRRQDKLDAMTAQQQQFDQQMHLRDMNLKESKEQREAEQHKADLAERASQNASQRDVMAENIKTKQIGDVEKQLGNMQPGDYPDSQLIANMDRLGMGANAPKPALGQQSMPGIVAPSAPQVAGIRVAPQPNEPPAQMGLTGSSDPAVRPYIGSPKQREAIDQKQKQQQFIDALPDGDPRKDEIRQALGAEATGLHVPPGFFSKQAGDGTEEVYRQNPRDGTIEKVGTVPKGAHFMTEPAPKDTSVGDALKADRQDRDLRGAKEKAYTEFNNAAKPFLDRIDRANKMEDSLKLHSNIADSTIAEQLVTLTAGGSGSGVRISQPMIDQVLHKTNTAWDDLSLRLKRWEAATPEDKNKISMFFTDTQRLALHDLGQLYLAEARKQHAKILDYRSKIDEAKDFDTVYKTRTAAQRDIFDTPKADEATPAGVAPTGTKRIRYDMNGKVIPDKVTP